jgi:FkbM family methyltransferase
MSYYWDEEFLKNIDISNVKVIFEIGSRYGDETLKLSEYFSDAVIYSFECNPNTIEICKNKLSNKKNINFFTYGLGDKEEKLPFYSFIDNNDGASSFLKRIDFEKTQKYVGEIKIKKLVNFVNENKIPKIDLLCMDIQGYELNVLKGAEDFIEKINYIIMEEPKKNINLKYLPPNIHSSYIGCPTAKEIQ